MTISNSLFLPNAKVTTRVILILGNDMVLKVSLTFMRKEIVMNIEKINMPPRPYK